MNPKILSKNIRRLMKLFRKWTDSKKIKNCFPIYNQIILILYKLVN
jgi:hypothetical protein